jgi:hypothetical protein
MLLTATVYSLVQDMQEHWNGQPHVVAYTDATSCQMGKLMLLKSQV